MTPIVHKIYITTLTSIVVITLVYLLYSGYSYYNTSLEERFFHERHVQLKPGGSWGHGYGIIGTLMMITGVFGYMARKRFKSLSRLGRLKHWLEFHIFLCTLGPILVLFHTAMKFGGIVSISFWSMVAVVISGVIGRFIYLQIPRTIEGRAMSLSEIQSDKTKLRESLLVLGNIDENELSILLTSTKSQSRKLIKEKGLSRKQRKKVSTLLKNEFKINRRIERLHTMQKLFKYWHVAHLPFALVMLVIMVVHVAITLAFGYKWIF
jgi:hypothetical protein